MSLEVAARARLLIVDPDPLTVRLIRAIFSGEGYEIDDCARGADAQRRILTFPPDVVLLELGLPDMPGLDLVLSLKAAPATRDIVVIVVTSRNGHEAEAAAIRAGVSGYVRKPIDPIALPPLVASLLGPNH